MPWRLTPHQVASLHGMSPGLRSSAVASFGDRLLTFEAKPGTRANTVLHDPSYHFVAHEGGCAGLCCSSSVAARLGVHLPTHSLPAPALSTLPPLPRPPLQVAW
jgi:hypothetical protein